MEINFQRELEKMKRRIREYNGPDLYITTIGFNGMGKSSFIRSILMAFQDEYELLAEPAVSPRRFDADFSLFYHEHRIPNTKVILIDSTGLTDIQDNTLKWFKYALVGGVKHGDRFDPRKPYWSSAPNPKPYNVKVHSIVAVARKQIGEESPRHPQGLEDFMKQLREFGLIATGVITGADTVGDANPIKDKMEKIGLHTYLVSNYMEKYGEKDTEKEFRLLEPLYEAFQHAHAKEMTNTQQRQQASSWF